MSAFQFTRAICRRIPRSLSTEALRSDPNVVVNYDEASRQQDAYLSALQQLKIEVIMLEADEGLPDCVFVEDAAVVIGKVALLTRLGSESRRNENAAMRNCLQSLDYKLIEMQEPACLDGGDVMFTGKELFVGLSTRTNQEGLKQLSAAFPDISAHGIEVKNGLHLKSNMSMAGQGLIAIAESNPELEASIKAKSQHSYQFLRIPDAAAANCVFANGTLLVCARNEFPNSRIAFDQINRRKIDVPNSELAKVDGGLTCCCILLN